MPASHTKRTTKNAFLVGCLLGLTALPVQEAFVLSPSSSISSRVMNQRTVVNGLNPDSSGELKVDLKKGIDYKPGAADTDLAKRYGHLVGKKVKTVGEAFADFTKELGVTVNALYKNMVTDLVGSTHLIVVNARFQRDPVWSLGMLTALDLLLKNYPEGQEMAGNIVSSLLKSVGIDEADVRKEAAELIAWVEGKSREDIEKVLSGEDTNGPLATVVATIKADEYWMYSRYFGIGLLNIMERIGLEMDKDEIYPVIDDWMGKRIGRSSLTACADSDRYFQIRGKLEMMETMMKEIEIREKKRMASRLEEKAEAALRAAEREEKFQAEVKAEVSTKKEGEEKKE